MKLPAQNFGLSQEEWRRYHVLIARRWAETLSEEERREFIAFTDRLEKANVRRMQALVELANRRGVSLETVMKDLGIEPPEYI
jgi:DNA primase catalytic subunit